MCMTRILRKKKNGGTYNQTSYYVYNVIHSNNYPTVHRADAALIHDDNREYYINCNFAFCNVK